MSRTRTTLRTLAATLPLLAPTGLAFAQSQVQQQAPPTRATFAPTQTCSVQQSFAMPSFPWNGTLSVPGFDPALGVLQCVQIDLQGDIGGSYGLENIIAANGCDVTSSVTLKMSVEKPTGGNFVSCPITSSANSSSLGAPDGSIDCAGNAGETYPVNASGSCNEAFCSDLPTFIGTPGNPGTVQLPIKGEIEFMLNSACIPAPCDNLNGQMRVTVCYLYSTANDDSATTPEDQSVLIDVFANDCNPQNDAVCGTGCGCTLDPTTVNVVTNPTNGSAVENGDGTVTYQPNADFCGSDVFTYVVMDAIGNVSNIATVTVDVTPINDCPVAAADAAKTDEDVPVDIPVCANDSDVDDAMNCGGGLLCGTVEPVGTAPMHGQVSANGDGTIKYTPDAGYCGTDSFQYRVQDAAGCWTSPTRVTVRVSGVNDAPVAVDDSATTAEEMTATISVCANDSDPDTGTSCGAPLDCTTVQLEVLPTGGTAHVDSQGRIVYMPGRDFCGADELRYSVADTAGLRSNTAIVSITVTPGNDCPIATDDSAQTNEDAAVSIPVCANDFDADTGTSCGGGLDCTTVAVVAGPGHGTATENGDGSVTYTPNADFCGTDSFTYVVSDTAGCTSSAATVMVTVNPLNDCPVANADAGKTDEDVAVSIDVCANDFDADDALSCGGGLDCSSVEVVGSGPLHGSALANGDGTITYTPGPGYCGGDTFQYRVKDTAGCWSADTRVTVRVSGVNDAPIAVADSATTPEDTSVNIAVCANDSDPDSAGSCGSLLDCTSVTIQSDPNNGSAVVLGDGRIQYVPHADFCGADSLTYLVRDLAGAPSNVVTVSITVTPGNDPPIAVADFATTPEATSKSIAVCANDFDIDANGSCGADIDCSTVVVASQPVSGGSATHTGGGTVSYTPAQGFCGTDTFTYTVKDTAGAVSGAATVTVTVQGVNQAPVALDDFAFSDGLAVEIPVANNDSDPDDGDGCGDPINTCSIQVLQTPTQGSVALSACGSFMYTPHLGAHTQDTFTYLIRDTAGVASNPANVTVGLPEPDPTKCDVGINRRTPGSLLLFPEFDNRSGMVTMFTVTNVGQSAPAGGIPVEFVYLDKDNCQEFNRTETLTAGDTFSLITNFHNPQMEQGFCYVFAKRTKNGADAVKYDNLIGQLVTFDGLEDLGFGFGVNAVAFHAAVPNNMGSTDVDHDGIRDLDGMEYDMAPARIMVPRFLGQVPGHSSSELILIGLSGGQEFTTQVYLEVMNDNEQVFSKEHSFYCWERTSLLGISNVFSNSFLAMTNDDPDEIVGLELQESGWMRIEGQVAYSTTTTIDDPAIYAVLIEHRYGTSSADLPFELCYQPNGKLFPRSLDGEH